MTWGAHIGEANLLENLIENRQQNKDRVGRKVKTIRRKKEETEKKCCKAREPIRVWLQVQERLQ